MNSPELTTLTNNNNHLSTKDKTNMTVAFIEERPTSLGLPLVLMKYSCPETDSMHEPVVLKQRQKSHTRAHVRFNREVIIHNSAPVDIPFDPHPESIWYSKSELEMLKKEDQRMIRAARLAGSDDVCLRGLEDRFSRRTSLESRRRQFAVYQAVFREQCKQRLKSTCNPEKIRRKSAAVSKSGREYAFLLAEKDALEAEHSETPSKRLRKSSFQKPGECGNKTVNIHIDHNTRTIIL